MHSQTLETLIANELLPGEKLLWSGQPDPAGRSVVSPARVFRILGWIYLPLGLLLLLTGFLLLFALPTSSAFLGTLILGGIFFLLGLVFLLVGAVVRVPTRGVCYALTSWRVLIVRAGRYLQVLSYEKRAITRVQRFERPDGSGDLVFWDSNPSGGQASSSAGSVPFAARGPGVFAAIARVHAVEQLLLIMLAEA
jgi:hypothetical protein